MTRILNTLHDCTHIDEVVRFVTETRGLTGIAAEAGVAKGRSVLPILPLFSWVYLIDLWPHSEEDYQECLANVSEYKDKLTVLRGLSWEMAEQFPDGSLDYLYIDADHEYESVKKDLYAYYPKMRSGVGAVMAGHDYGAGHPGVNKAVDEFVIARGIPVVNTSLGCSYSWSFEKP